MITRDPTTDARRDLAALAQSADDERTQTLARLLFYQPGAEGLTTDAILSQPVLAPVLDDDDDADLTELLAGIC